MPARLILNADDFGLTPGVNRAIGELQAIGALTSATLMARGAAFADAVRDRPGQPRPWRRLPHRLHRRRARFPTRNGADPARPRSPQPPPVAPCLPARRGHRPPIRPDELKREAVAQIRTLQEAGLHVTHVDTHKHTHTLPQIAGPLLEATLETGVHAIRNPFEAPWSLRLGHPPLLRLLSVAGSRLLRRSFLAQPAIRSGAVRTTEGTLGISATGRLDEPTLRRILAALPDSGAWELVCHPGYNDRDLDAVTTRLRQTRETERKALLAVLSTQNAQTQNSQLNNTGPTLQTSSPQSSTLNNTRHNIPHRPPPELIHYGRL